MRVLLGCVPLARPLLPGKTGLEALISSQVVTLFFYFNARKSLEEKNMPAATTLKKSPIDLHLNAAVTRRL